MENEEGAESGGWRRDKKEGQQISAGPFGLFQGNYLDNVTLGSEGVCDPRLGFASAFRMK